MPPSAAAKSPWRPDVASAEAQLPTAKVSAVDGSDSIDVVAGSPADVRLAEHQTPVPTAIAAAAAQVAAPPLSAPPAQPADAAPVSTSPRVRFEGLSPRTPSDARVAEMQIRLSKIVVEPPTAWQLAGLRQETASLLAQEPSAEARAELRDLLDRIATFETIQSRYASTRTPAAIAGPAAPPAIASAQPESMAPMLGKRSGDASEVLDRVRADLGRDPSITPTPGATQTAQAAPVTEALYDAVGTLKPVVSRREGAPRFALVDDHGDVVTFVTASADVNLQSYVGKRIGVRGPRGFMPEYRRAHVTASRVTPLEEKLVR